MSKRAERRAKKYGPDFMRNMHPFRFFTPVVVGTGKGGFNQFFFVWIMGGICLSHPSHNTLKKCFKGISTVIT